MVLVLAATLLAATACGRDPLERLDGGASRLDGGGAAGAMDAPVVVTPPTPFASGSYCTREADRRARCGLEPNGGQCQRDSACYGKVFRREAQVGLADCLTTRPCAMNDDTCFAAAAAPFVKTPAFQHYRDVCSAKVLACGGTAGEVKDRCSDVLAIASDDFLADLLTCFTAGRGGLSACQSAKLNAAGCN